MKLDSKLIDSYLKEKIEFIYTDFLSEIYLVGGAVRNLLMNKNPKDIDIVVLSDSDEEIISLINKYNLKYKKNSFNGYKIYYQDIEIDIWNSNDLYKCIEYNVEGLFYNIKHQLFIPFGFYQAIETKQLKKINSDNELNKKSNRKTINTIRKEKLLKTLKEVGDFFE